ncbi:MAG: response regulator [Oligoflexia bacterium]|nr:response regulator [Oligoflexia bacterium]
MALNILLLEDNQAQHKEYEQALEDDELQDSYTLLKASNIKTARKLIKTEQINAAILDLKVPAIENGPADTENGLSYCKELLKKKQFPIIVVSANITSIKGNESGIPPHLKILNREMDVHSKAFQYFESKKDLLEISPLFPEAIQDIHSELQNSFWEMWGHWDEINSRFNHKDPEKTKTFLKRYVCSHLIEKWMAHDLFNEMHHTEFYTHPPLKDRIDTGDILELKNEFWIVMTAPCDLSNYNYPKNLTLLKCQPVELNNYAKVVKPFREDNSQEEAKNKQKEKVRRYFTEPQVGEHYLPPWSKTGKPVNVLFKDIKTVPFSEDCREKLKSSRIATLSYHFLPYLLQRYGTYVSRIGQSDVSTDDYIEYLLSVVPKSESKS